MIMNMHKLKQIMVYVSSEEAHRITESARDVTFYSHHPLKTQPVMFATLTSSLIHFVHGIYIATKKECIRREGVILSNVYTYHPGG